MSTFEEFVNIFTENKIDYVRKIGRNYYFVENDLWELKESINKDVFSVGIFLGEEKDRFEPNPAILDIISKFPDSEKRKIFVNKKAEWLFLCGRNILSDSISKNPYRVNSGLVLVQNENNENLGFGYFKQEGPALILRNILDKGHYLRIEDKKGKRGKKKH